ncbi:hypothetical protein ELG73_03910 [Rhizobium leguminosarum]|nr:hypothetical protein ELG73_03910 [Rhizobium leguminosarum]
MKQLLMQVSEKSITQMGYRPQGSRPFLVFISCQLTLRNFRAQNRAAPLLKLRLRSASTWMLGWRQWLPLTLTLSPLAGRGDVPNATSRLRKPVRHIPFAPRAGRRCRQADEGLDLKRCGTSETECYLRQSRAGARLFAGRRRRVGRRPARPW